MSLAIYGDLRTGVFSSEAALAEAGADYEFVQVSLEAKAQKAPAFLAINPSGKVPALRLSDGTIVTESLAILLTIADLFPEARLLPPTGERARTYRWLAFMAGEIYPFVEISDYPARFVPEGEQAKALRAKARARLHENLALVEREIAGPWFLASGFSLLDIYAAMFTRWRGSFSKETLTRESIPKLRALAQKLSERDRIAPVWARHFGNDPKD